MESTGKVSIITVCYNSEHTIRETVESIISQDYENFEYIVKDGGSVDNTLGILYEYVEKFEKRNINYIIISETDKSLYEAMNIGIDMSTGQWLNFMNAGDCFYDSYVLSSIFRNNYESVVLFGDNLIEDEFGSGLNIADMNVIEKKMPFNHQAAFFNASYIKKYMYNENLKIGADYDLVLKLYESGCSFEHLDLIVSKYRLDGISSTKYVAVAKERIKIRKSHGFQDNLLIAEGKMIEAYIKEYLEKYCPRLILRYLNHYYKKYIKKYVLEE